MIPDLLPIPFVYALFALSVLCSGLYLLRCHQPASLYRSVTKTGAIAGLAFGAAVIWLSGSDHDAPVPLLLVAALSASALGDYLLSCESEAGFRIGAISFALAHLLYAVLMLTLSASDPARFLTDGAIQVMLALLLIFGVVMAAVLWRKAGEERVLVVVYIPFILSMSVAALTLRLTGALDLLPIAVLLFLVSDTLLAADRFLLKPGGRLRAAAVWLSYWSSQALFFVALGWAVVK